MKTKLLTFILLINVLLLNAQDFEWTVQQGPEQAGTNQNYSSSSVIDSNNNVITTGVFDTSIDLDPSANTAIFNSESANTNMFIQKLDENSNFIWGIRFGGTSNTGYTKKVVVDNNDDIIIIGGFLTRVNLDPSGVSSNILSNGSWDGFIAKYSGVDGSFIWGYNIGGTGYDAIKDIATGHEYLTNNAHNYFVICGSFSNTVDFNPSGSSINLTSNGSVDGFVMKYQSSNGNLIFDYVIGGTGYDYINSLDIKDDIASSQYLENIIFTGQFNSDANGIDFDYSNNDDFIVATYTNFPFITMLDKNFNYVRTNTMDLQDDDSFKRYKIAFNNYMQSYPRYYIAGNFKGTLDTHISNESFYNQATENEAAFFLIGTMSSTNQGYNGFQFVNNNHDGSDYIKIEAIKAIEEKLYITGEYNGEFSMYKDANWIYALSTSDMKDIFLMSFGSNWDLSNTYTFGGSGDDYAYSLYGYEFAGDDGNVSTHPNYFTISGSFQNTVDFDLSTATNNLTANGSSDGFTFKFNNEAPTASVFDTELFNLSVYPNPTKNTLNFITENNEVIKNIVIYDVQGRKVLQQIPINNKISIAHLDKGIYFLKATINGKIATQKIVKN